MNPDLRLVPGPALNLMLTEPVVRSLMIKQTTSMRIDVDSVVIGPRLCAWMKGILRTGPNHRGAFAEQQSQEQETAMRHIKPQFY